MPVGCKSSPGRAAPGQLVYTRRICPDQGKACGLAAGLATVTRGPAADLKAAACHAQRAKYL
jgi:hypothetical protein